MAMKDNYVVSGSRDNTLRLWNLDTFQCEGVLQGHVAAVRCVCFDGKKIVSGSYDYTVKVYFTVLPVILIIIPDLRFGIHMLKMDRNFSLHCKDINKESIRFNSMERLLLVVH